MVAFFMCAKHRLTKTSTSSFVICPGIPQSIGSVLFFAEDFIDFMENRPLFFTDAGAEVADPLGEVGGETSPALPCINSSAVH